MERVTNDFKTSQTVSSHLMILSFIETRRPLGIVKKFGFLGDNRKNRFNQSKFLAQLAL